MLIESFDIDSDFWSDPQLRILFKEEFDNKVSSKTMWAIVLCVHPKSKFADLSLSTKEAIIGKDYLGDTSFKLSNYSNTAQKVKDYLLTTMQQLLSVWNNKLHEITQFLDQNPYTVETAEMLTKVMKDLYPISKQYKEIQKEFLKEEELATFGGVEESLSEKKLI